jgi:hypothetical protein
MIRMIKSREDEWAGHVILKREKKNAYKILIRKAEGRNPVGISRRRWEDNIKWILKK